MSDAPTESLRMGLTAQQAKVLAFIRDYIEAHDGVSPSYQNIADHLGHVSPGNVRKFMDGLESRGYITRDPKHRRSITVLRRPSVPVSAAPVDPIPSNMPRYQAFEAGLRRNFLLVSGELPLLHEDKALQWLAVALLTSSDAMVVERLRRLSGALSNYASELERQAGPAF